MDKHLPPRESQLSIVLAEPSPLLREKLVNVLGRHPRVWCVTGVDGDPRWLARVVEGLKPDFVLAALSVWRQPGLLMRLRGHGTACAMLALLDADGEPYRQTVHDLGLDGVVLRARAGEWLVAVCEQQGSRC